MVEPRGAQAAPKRRREEGFTADVKAYAVAQHRVSGDAVQAARATEAHFASQHRVFLLQPRLVRLWATTGAGGPVRFKQNARGGPSNDTDRFCVLGEVVVCGGPHPRVAARAKGAARGAPRQPAPFPDLSWASWTCVGRLSFCILLGGPRRGSAASKHRSSPAAPRRRPGQEEEVEARRHISGSGHPGRWPAPGHRRRRHLLGRGARQRPRLPAPRPCIVHFRRQPSWPGWTNGSSSALRLVQTSWLPGVASGVFVLRFLFAAPGKVGAPAWCMCGRLGYSAGCHPWAPLLGPKSGEFPGLVLGTVSGPISGLGFGTGSTFLLGGSCCWRRAGPRSWNQEWSRKPWPRPGPPCGSVSGTGSGSLKSMFLLRPW